MRSSACLLGCSVSSDTNCVLVSSFLLPGRSHLVYSLPLKSRQGLALNVANKKQTKKKNELFYVLFLRTGTHSPLQSKEPKQSKQTSASTCARAHTHTHARAHTHTHTRTHALTHIHTHTQSIGSDTFTMYTALVYDITGKMAALTSHVFVTFKRRILINRTRTRVKDGYLYRLVIVVVVVVVVFWGPRCIFVSSPLRFIILIRTESMLCFVLINSVLLNLLCVWVLI